MLRSRIAYAIAAFATIVLGLLWRSHWIPLAPFFRKYGGDSLWALMVFFMVRFVRPRATVVWSSLVAFGISGAVETSQLYRAPWIEAIRHTRIGLLVLGSTFNWGDLPAYAVGVLMGMVLVSRR